MANSVVAMRMIDGNGNIIIMNQTYNTDIFDAALISFGSLGIITPLTVQLAPIFNITRFPDIVFTEQNTLQIVNHTLHQNVSVIANNFEYFHCLYMYVW